MIKKTLLYLFIPALLSFSFPPVNIGLFFIIAYTLLLFLIKDIDNKQKNITVFIVFFIFWFFLLQWILFINVDFTFIQHILIFIGFILLCSVLSLIWTLPFVFINMKNKTVFLLPVFFSAIEFLCSIENNTAFIWFSPAYAIIKLIPLIQIADIGGMFFVSFFVLMIIVLIYRIIILKGKQRYIEGGILIFLIVLNILYGINAMKREYGYKDYTITIVQPNIPAIVKQDYYTYSKHRINRIKYFLNKMINIKQDLIIFPETSSPVYLQRKSAFSEYIKEYVEKYNKNIIMGSLRIEYDKQQHLFKYFNSVFFINRDNKKLDNYYDKIRPLGFAERLPFDDKFECLRKIPLGQGNFSPGKEYAVFNIKNAKVGVYICFESVFSTIPVEFVKRGAELLINVSEDIWFQNNVGPYQHFYAGIMRSIENRRFIVRVSNPGISAIINPIGKIEQTVPIYNEGILTHNIKLCKNLTFFTKYDNIIPKLFVILMIVYILIFIYKRRKYVSNKS